MIASFQANTKIVVFSRISEYKQLLHFSQTCIGANVGLFCLIVCDLCDLKLELYVSFTWNVFWNWVLMCTSIRNILWNGMFLSLWTCFETGQSCAPHFKTFNRLCLTYVISWHFCLKWWDGWVPQSFLSRNPCFDPPRCHSHPNCTLALCWDSWSSHSRHLPQSCAEKRSVSCGSRQANRHKATLLFPLRVSWMWFVFTWRGVYVFGGVSRF